MPSLLLWSVLCSAASNQSAEGVNQQWFCMLTHSCNGRGRLHQMTYTAATGWYPLRSAINAPACTLLRPPPSHLDCIQCCARGRGDGAQHGVSPQNPATARPLPVHTNHMYTLKHLCPAPICLMIGPAAAAEAAQLARQRCYDTMQPGVTGRAVHSSSHTSPPAPPPPTHTATTREAAAPAGNSSHAQPAEARATHTSPALLAQQQQQQQHPRLVDKRTKRQAQRHEHEMRSGSVAWLPLPHVQTCKPRT